MKFSLLLLAGSLLGKGISLDTIGIRNLLDNQISNLGTVQSLPASLAKNPQGASLGVGLPQSHQLPSKIRTVPEPPTQKNPAQIQDSSIQPVSPTAYGLESAPLTARANELDLTLKHERSLPVPGQPTGSLNLADVSTSRIPSYVPRSHLTQKGANRGIFPRADVPEVDWVTKAKIRAKHADDMAQRQRMPTHEAERAKETKALYKESRTAARKDIKEAHRALDQHLQQASGERFPSPVKRTFSKARNSINEAYSAGMRHASYAAEAAVSAEERSRWSEVRGHISSSARATSRADTLRKLGQRMQTEQQIAIQTSENAAQPKSITDRVAAERANSKQLHSFKDQHRDYDAAYNQYNQIRRTFSGSSSEEEYMPRERNGPGQ